MSGKKLVTRGDLMPTGDISIAEVPKKFSLEVIFLNIFAHFEEKRKSTCTVYLFTKSFLAEEDRIFPSGDSKKAKYQENPS